MGEELDIGAYTSPGNRYGELNQDYVEVWRPARDGTGGSAPPLLIGAVLDGHGLLGESAARTGGGAVVRELRRLVGLAVTDGGAVPVGHGTSNGGSTGVESGEVAGNGTPQQQHAQQPPPLLGSITEQELHSLMERAFSAAHEASLAIYDDPPRTANYPDARTGAAAVYCLQRHGGLPVYSAPACSRGGAPPPIRPLEFGATCTVALLQGRRLVVGNVGDSSAVLGSLDDDGGVSARLLTRQHCGLHPDEAARINQDFSGRVRILPHDGYMSVSGHSLFAGYELAVTRALGHKHIGEEFGVLHSPSVACLDLAPEDCCIVLASDGVWDVMDPREVVNRVMDSLSAGAGAAAAAQALVKDAVALAEGAPAGDADNTSAVVISLPLGG